MTLLEGVLNPLQRCSWCIIQLSSRLGHRTLVWEELPLCRDAVGVFYSPSRQNHRTLVEEVLNPLQRCSWFIIQLSSRLGHRTLVWEELPLCRDAVGVFYSPSRQNHRTLVEGVLNPLQRCSWFIIQLSNRLGHRTPVGVLYSY